MKDSPNSKYLKSLCVERKYEQIIHKLNRNNNDTFNFNQSQLYITHNNHENNTDRFSQELCERNHKENLNPHTNINLQTNTKTNKNK